jgi:Mn2+/Fe2+ NRAMP family transporter
MPQNFSFRRMCPLMAVGLLWLTNLRSVMGAHYNDLWMNFAAGAGLNCWS